MLEVIILREKFVVITRIGMAVQAKLRTLKMNIKE